MATEASEKTDLTKLPDPALISAWALARVKVALNRDDSRAKEEFSELRAEYRRRLYGAWS